MFQSEKYEINDNNYYFSTNPTTTEQYQEYEEPPVDYSEDEEQQHYEHNIQYLRPNRIYEPSSNYNSNDLKVNNNNSKPQPSWQTNHHEEQQKLFIINFNSLWFESLIGQGGFGKVYRGKWNNHCVAIKEPIYYDKNLLDHINEAIIEEARLHYHLSHPNIIQLYGVSFKGDRVHLVMEYARGRSLRELISKRTLPPNVIIKFAIQISSAMEYLHNFQPCAIIHRDLKSPNILLNEPVHSGADWSNKQLKLTDLGLAQEFTHSTRMSQCGTWTHMAPESIADSKFSKSSDVWSYGVCLWELLTGQIPYRDFSAPAIAFGIGNGRLTLPIPTTCPEELKRILQACWNQDPKQRPSFTEIRLQLQKSSFNVINLEQFRKMKQNWFAEIENIWQSLKEKEKELESREEEAKRKEAETRRKEEEVEMLKQALKQQSEELRRREIEVVSRELNVLLQVQQASQQEPSKLKRRPSRKKLAASQTKIGYPQNFCHNLTITSSQDQDYATPILQARALNKTWGPGTKIRPELHANLFSNNHPSKSSKQSINNSREEFHSGKDGKPPKVKRLGSFLRRIFKHSSKSRVNLQDDDEDARDADVEEDGQYEDDDDREEYHHNEIRGYKFSEGRDYAQLNRTYHGQTKYSERKRLVDYYEHFQQPIYSHQPQQNDDDDDEDQIDCDVRPLATYNYHQDYNNNHPHDCNNVYYCPSSSHSQHSSNSKATTATTNTTSDRDLDADLLQEFNRFEQEFQSMHCSS